MAARIAGGGRIFLIYLFSLKPGENNSHVEDASSESGEKHLLTGRHSQENSLQTELVKELLPLSPPNNCFSTTLLFSLFYLMQKHVDFTISLAHFLTEDHMKLVLNLFLILNLCLNINLILGPSQTLRGKR